MDTRTCLACNVPLGANRTNEHVIAEWLLAELSMNEEQLTHVLANSVTNEVSEPRPQHVMNSFKEGRVCGRCNSGWMSTLESQAQNVLPDLMHGRRAPGSLTDVESTVVSRWTLKTAVVLSHATATKKALPKDHLQFLRTNPLEMPSQVGVFAAIAPSTCEFGHRQRNDWENATAMETDFTARTEIMNERSYKVGLQLRNLLLLADYLPFATSAFLLVAGFHVPLWPNGILPCRRKKIELPDPYDSIHALAAFCDTLGAVHQSGEE